MRPAYTHRQGQVLDHGRPITLAKASEALAAHTLGAKRMRDMRCVRAAELSERLARELTHAIEAAAGFNRLIAARGKTSTGVAISKGSAA